MLHLPLCRQTKSGTFGILIAAVVDRILGWRIEFRVLVCHTALK
jgi:hypothetical protein